MLNNQKSTLSELVAGGQRLRKLIAERKAELARFDTDLLAVVDEKSHADRTLRQLKAEQDDMCAACSWLQLLCCSSLLLHPAMPHRDNPTIIDYIRLKHQVSEQEKQVGAFAGLAEPHFRPSA